MLKLIFSGGIDCYISSISFTHMPPEKSNHGRASIDIGYFSGRVEVSQPSWKKRVKPSKDLFKSLMKRKVIYRLGTHIYIYRYKKNMDKHTSWYFEIGNSKEISYFHAYRQTHRLAKGNKKHFKQLNNKTWQFFFFYFLNDFFCYNKGVVASPFED